AGLLVPPIPYLQQPLAEWVLGHMSNERWAAVLYALLLFGPSTMLLGTVSPFAVRLASRHVERIGNVAGRLYALSTAGSIFGTLFTAFYWMDVAGVRAITASIGWVLLALGVVLVVAAALSDGAGPFFRTKCPASPGDRPRASRPRPSSESAKEDRQRTGRPH